MVILRSCVRFKWCRDLVFRTVGPLNERTGTESALRHRRPMRVVRNGYAIFGAPARSTMLVQVHDGAIAFTLNE
jgi:hypothetical protein